jgi:hypothetical protein
MKNRMFVLGIMLLSFSLGTMIIGCNNGTDPTGDPKSLTLTGLPTGKTGVWVGMNGGADFPIVAHGWASLSGNKTTVTIPLKNGGDGDTEDWTGTGEYFLFITLQVDFEGNETQYFYSDGEPIPENMSSGIKKFNFDTASKILDFSKFAEPKD